MFEVESSQGDAVSPVKRRLRSGTKGCEKNIWGEIASSEEKTSHVTSERDLVHFPSEKTKGWESEKFFSHECWNFGRGAACGEEGTEKSTHVKSERVLACVPSKKAKGRESKKSFSQECGIPPYPPPTTPSSKHVLIMQIHWCENNHDNGQNNYDDCQLFEINF